MELSDTIKVKQITTNAMKIIFKLWAQCLGFLKQVSQRLKSAPKAVQNSINTSTPNTSKATNGNTVKSSDQDGLGSSDNKISEKFASEVCSRLFALTMSVFILVILCLFYFSVMKINVDGEDLEIKGFPSEYVIEEVDSIVHLNAIKSYTPQDEKIVRRYIELHTEQTNERFRVAHKFANTLIIGRLILVFLCISIFGILAYTALKGIEKSNDFRF